MRDKPESCYASSCPLAVTCRKCKKKIEDHLNEKGEDGHEFESLGHGFSLGSGDPRRAKYAFVLEAPGREEIVFALQPVAGRAFFADPKSVATERNIRKRDYPTLEERYITRGAPVVGRSGAQLQYQAWPKAGIDRNDVYLDNTIRCLPPVSANGAAYPTGKTKALAELACRQYDRIAAFRPDTIVFSLHPAGLLREITPLPLQVKDMERVRDFAKAGRRVLALLGGKATHAFARFGSNVTRWRGHYFALPFGWVDKYKSYFEVKGKERAKKKDKLIDDEFFPVDAGVKSRMTEKRTRPSETNPEACKSFKRYRGKRPPKCGCEPCWLKYKEMNK